MNSGDLESLLGKKPGLTKSETIQFLAQMTGLTRVETETVVDGLLGIVQEVLSRGKKVELRGFGTFSVRTRQPREARNPATQEKVMLGKRFVPVFRPSKSLRGAVDQALGAGR